MTEDEIKAEAKRLQDKMKTLTDPQLVEEVREAGRRFSVLSLRLLDVDPKLYGMAGGLLAVTLEMAVRFESYSAMIAAGKMIQERMENVVLAIQTSQDPRPKN